MGSIETDMTKLELLKKFGEFYLNEVRVCEPTNSIVGSAERNLNKKYGIVRGAL